MRYLQIISSLDPVHGGPVEGITKLTEAGMRLGHEVEIVTLDPPGAEWAAGGTLPVHFLGPTHLGKYAYAPRLIPWLHANVDRFQAAIVNGLWQYQGLAVWRALHTRALPYFVFPHGMLDPWFKRRYPLKHLKKALYWHGVEYRVLRDARGVLFTCEEERLQARLSFPDYRAREIVVSYGTSGPPDEAAAQREAFLQAFPRLRGRRFMLFLGRIHPKKGCDLLVQAFAGIARQRPELDLVMAGPDPGGIRKSLLARAPDLAPERIVWTGMLSGRAKWGAFRAAEAFVLPSHQENFGVAVAEAMACGTPVLISNKVNIWREIAAGNGGLVDDDTLDGTRRLLQRWLALDPAEQARMRTAAQESFRSRFHIESVARDLLATLQIHSASSAVPRQTLAAT